MSSPGARFVATAAAVVSVLAALALIAAPGGVWAGMWEFGFGFQLLRWAVYLGTAGLALGLAAVAVGWVAGERRARALGVLALVMALPSVAVPLSQYRRARSLPPINDVTTDFANPPAFTVAGRALENGAAGVTYPGEAFARQQAEAYPDVVTLALPEAPPEVFRAALAAARGLPGWEVLLADSSSGAIEASVTTRWFRFVDDVAVRVQPASGGGSELDLRSRSRVGVSDVGANAERIRGFRSRLLAELGREEEG